MKLALRTKPASTAWNHRLANWIIRLALFVLFVVVPVLSQAADLARTSAHCDDEIPVLKG